MTLCNTERASTVRRLRRPRMTSPHLCHCRPASQSASSSAVFCASSFAWTAAPCQGGPLHWRLRGSQTHSCFACRRGHATGCHLHTAAPVKSVHVLRDAADAALQLLQLGGREASSRPASWAPRLLKGLLDTVLHFLQLQPILLLNGAPLLQRASINSRIRRLGGSGFGCRGRQPV